MENLTEAEKAYIAGVFDGEGCLGFYLHGKTHAFCVIICNSDARLMNWLSSHLAFGNVEANRSNKGRFPTHKLMWQWKITRRQEVKAFLNAILPYAVIKRDQILLAIEHLNTEPVVGKGYKLHPAIIKNRECLVKELKRLKRVSTSLAVM